jgi:hypothetical protein
MIPTSKLSQLQLRVTEDQKAAIRRAAERAGMDMSAYVLSRVLPSSATRFQNAVSVLAGPNDPSFALAEINAFLSKVSTSELAEAIAAAPEVSLPAYEANYLAALVESACSRHMLPIPAWVRSVPPLQMPAFGSELPSLRLYLLTRSPPAFRQRNIFVDSGLGDRV